MAMQIKDSITIRDAVPMFNLEDDERLFREVSINWHRGRTVRLQLSDRTLKDVRRADGIGGHGKCRTLECTVSNPWTKAELNKFLSKERVGARTMAEHCLKTFDKLLHAATSIVPEIDVPT